MGKDEGVGVDEEVSISNGNHKVVNEDLGTPLLGVFDKPLPCCGCGIGWSSFLIGFLIPLAWYFATILYFCNYYRRDPRERSGLAACAVAALVSTVAGLITMAVILL